MDQMNKLNQNEQIFMEHWKAATGTVKLVKRVKLCCPTCLPSHKVPGGPLSAVGGKAEGPHIWTAESYSQLWFLGTTVR